MPEPEGQTAEPEAPAPEQPPEENNIEPAAEPDATEESTPDGNESFGGERKDSGEDNSAEGPEEVESPNHREARYRREARAAEAQRDALQARVDAQDKASAEQVAAEYLADPADLWAFGAEVSDLRDDEGTLDAEQVRVVLGELVERKPYLTGQPVDARQLLAAQAERVQRGERPVPVRQVSAAGMAPDPSQGAPGGTPSASDAEQWQQVLRGR